MREAAAGASSETHDRLVFRDDVAERLLMGSSPNDAVKKSPMKLKCISFNE
jgi:hypothetical protein